MNEGKEMSVLDHIKALGLCLCLPRLDFTHSILVIIFCHPYLHQSDGDAVHYKTKISTNKSIRSFLCENREVCDGSKKLEGGELQEEENWAQNQYLVWKITNTERRKD